MFSTLAEAWISHYVFLWRLCRYYARYSRLVWSLFHRSGNQCGLELLSSTLHLTLTIRRLFDWKQHQSINWSCTSIDNLHSHQVAFFWCVLPTMPDSLHCTALHCIVSCHIISWTGTGERVVLSTAPECPGTHWYQCRYSTVHCFTLLHVTSHNTCFNLIILSCVWLCECIRLSTAHCVYIIHVYRNVCIT